MLYTVYKCCGIRVRDYRGAQSPRHIEPAGFVGAVGRRDRAATGDAAADRLEAPPRAARRRPRRIRGGRTAPAVQAETTTAAGGGRLAGSIPEVLVHSRRCARTPPGPHASLNTSENANEKKEAEERQMTVRDQYAP